VQKYNNFNNFNNLSTKLII